MAWRKRRTGWTAYWLARKDILAKGYGTSSTRLWPPANGAQAPSDDEWQTIASVCAIQQDRMLNWAKGSVGEGWNVKSVYDGTIASLIKVYKGDPDSRYAKLRFHTRKHYDSQFRTLTKDIGAAIVPALTFRDFKRWYEKFSQPEFVGGPLRHGRAHGMMTHLRLALSFGVLCKLSGCKDARETMAELEFQMPKPRTTVITPEQIVAVIEKAHDMGYPSIALAQALQDGCIVRQKDVIGEWLPVSEPGLSDVVARGEKWLSGFRWEECSPTFVLEHRLSKSLRGRDSLSDATAGKVKSYDLKLRPLVMAELARIPQERRHGPMIICEYTGLPWRAKMFAEKWREIATAVGIPSHVQNRDTRAGGITHGRKSGVSLEDMRHAAGHSMLSTTAGYDRDDLETDAKIAVLRAKNGPRTA